MADRDTLLTTQYLIHGEMKKSQSRKITELTIIYILNL